MKPTPFHRRISRAERIVERVNADHAAMDSRRSQAERILDELAAHKRVVISGGPRTGKSTVAVRAGERYGRQVRHADALVGKLDWHGMSEEVAKWIDAEGDYIIEGVTAPRAIRRWLKDNPGKPLDLTVVHFREPVQTQTDKQRAMSKGVETVWQEILPELRKRGANVIERETSAAPAEPINGTPVELETEPAEPEQQEPESTEPFTIPQVRR